MTQFIKAQPIKNLLSGIVMMSILASVGCQSTPKHIVMERPDSTFETTGLGQTKIIAQQNALAGAKEQCGRYSPVVLTNNVIYNGVLDERAGRMIDQVGSVVGTILGTGSPDLSREDDYEYTITFRCR